MANPLPGPLSPGSDEGFRTLADAVPALVRICSPQGQNACLNARWHEFAGQSAAEAAGYGWPTATASGASSASIAPMPSASHAGRRRWSAAIQALIASCRIEPQAA
jgi:hypothetical protein